MAEESLEYPRGFDRDIVFESYGVRVKIEAKGAEVFNDAVQTARKALVYALQVVENGEAEHTFGISADDSGTLYLLQNGEQISFDNSRTRFFKFFNSILRLVVAEHAQGKVFIHAGVVGWCGKAILLPANSFQGKTTLVAELVKNGAEYYSDEYAVLDEDGMVHPFPRDLSIRDSEFGETDVPVTALGGKTGTKAIPVGAVLFTSYSDGSEWRPEHLSIGHGILELIPHTIPRNHNAEFSLKVLNTSLSDAIILKSPRGDAREFAIILLAFFDTLLV